MQYDNVYDFITEKMRSELPSHLSYHNLQHTLNVIAYVEHLVKKENIAPDEIVILKTAALFHDTGYLHNHVNHENISCEIAQKYLPQFEYSAAQIEQVCELIRATSIPQTPTSHLAKILCDADLFYLGSPDYSDKANLLFSEYKSNKIVDTRANWLKNQCNFFREHQYFTDTAKSERNYQKQKNHSVLKSELKYKIPLKYRNTLSSNLQDFALNTIGVLFAAFALKCFLVPNHFFDGGVTGLSLLVHEIYGLNLSAVILILNLPFIILSYFTISKTFALRIQISIIFLSIILLLIPEVALTTDKLLISVFGGIFLGLGIGLVMRSGSALDGTEVLALYTLKRTSFTITEIILLINIMIFGIAAFAFGIEPALYSVLTYFAATRTIDYVVEGIQAYTGVTIISAKSDEIKNAIVNKLGRGITVYKGERGFLPGHFEVSADVDIIFTVITRLEMRRLKNLVYQVDAQAFVFASTIKEAAGGTLNRRHSH